MIDCNIPSNYVFFVTQNIVLKIIFYLNTEMFIVKTVGILVLEIFENGEDYIYMKKSLKE